jgi:hypothetical protein
MRSMPADHCLSQIGCLLITSVMIYFRSSAASSPNNHRNGGWIKRYSSARGMRRVDNAKLVHRYVNASITNPCEKRGQVLPSQCLLGFAALNANLPMYATPHGRIAK